MNFAFLDSIHSRLHEKTPAALHFLHACCVILCNGLSSVSNEGMDVKPYTIV